MKTIIRIEYSDGNGLFRARDEAYNCIINNLLCDSQLNQKHFNFPTPSGDKLINRVIEKDEFCAFKSIEQIKEWIEPEWFNEIIDAGFKILLLDVSECVEGEYQIIFKKTNIINSKDITKLFKTKL